jgi:hypothetical protein
MKKTYVSVKDGALKLGMRKGEVRSLIKKNLIDYKLENGTYVVDVRSAKRIVYKPIPREVRRWVDDMRQQNLPSAHKIIQKERNGVEYLESVVIERIGRCEYKVERINRFLNIFSFVIKLTEDGYMSGKGMKSRIYLSPKRYMPFDKYGKMINILNDDNSSFLTRVDKMKYEMVMNKNRFTKEDFERFKSTFEIPF